MSVTVTEGGGRVTVVATPQTATVETVRVVEVDVPGPQGPQGPAGPQGSAGSSGGSYVHDQAVPAATWTITHSLGMYPNATVIDSAGSEVIGQVAYPSANTLQIVFSAAFAGTAYLS